jgi:uncharacterized protein (DUF952 family)
MATIYHITSAADWKLALEKGFYTAPSMEMEGFIHCSEAHQVAGVLQRYFAGRDNLVKLVIDTNKLQHRLQYDFSESVKEEFPHVYGPINLDAVITVESL